MNLHPSSEINQGKSTADARAEQAEALLAECRILLEMALCKELSIHAAARFLLKIENWEATK